MSATSSVQGSDIKKTHFLDKVQVAAPVSWVAIDLISMIRNSFAETDISGMVAPQVTNAQSIFSGFAMVAGACITAAGVLFALRGIRALLTAETKEKKLYAVLDIIYGIVMIFGGLSYALSWAGLTLKMDPAVLQFASKWGLPVGILACYGSGLLISALKAGRHGFSLPTDVLEQSDQDFKKWLLDKDDEWLSIHVQLTRDEITKWDHKNSDLKATARTKNADLFKADCLNVVANIIGGIAFAIALYPGEFFGGLTPDMMQKVSSGLFVTAGALFLPGDTGLIMGVSKKWEELKKKLKEMIDTAQHSSSTYHCIEKLRQDLAAAMNKIK